MADVLGSDGHRRRATLDPPPDALRGDLERHVVPLPGEPIIRTGNAHAALRLATLPAASDFDDPALANPAVVLSELHAQGIAADIVGRFRERRQARKKRSGRDRHPGDAELLYLAYVLSGRVAVQPFLNSVSAEVLTLCNYDRFPPLSTIEDRFEELEHDWQVYRDVKNVLLRIAIHALPEILQITWVDPTTWVTSARLQHVCPGRCKRSGGEIANSPVDEVTEARASEVDDLDWGTPEFERRFERTRLPFIEHIRAENGRDVTYGLYRLEGCLFRSRDFTSGWRTLDRNIHWFGGYAYPLVSALLGEPLEVLMLPADVQEYDGLPTLLSSVIEGVGRRPDLISFDKASFTRNVYEYLTRRGIAVITPEKRIKGKESHRDWRTVFFDEDGVPRCPGCLGPGNQSWPGLGLTGYPRRPVITFLCAFPSPTTPRCEGIHSVSCELEWLKLTALSRLTELHHAVAERHSPLESQHGHQRDRFTIAGKVSQRALARAGLPAQQLRSAASLLLLWLRLGIRNGWIPPLASPVEVNASAIEYQSALQDRRTGELKSDGIGAQRLQRLLLAREQAGLHIPYPANSRG